MDLTKYRGTSSELQRTADLLRLMPAAGKDALDIGARDGHFSILMAERYDRVFAIDLAKPSISHPKVQCLQSNAAEMAFRDNSFDLVFCAEVLEHVPTVVLHKVCDEIQRVARSTILIGVPYKQDLRIGRTTCRSCCNTNPPYGHVNSFDEKRIESLFGACAIEEISFVGVTTARTNALSTALMDFAGNPYGTYDQEESCIHCGRKMVSPHPRNLAQLVATKLAFYSRIATQPFARPRGNWIHVVLHKK